MFFFKLIACADGPLGMSNGEIKDWQITASSTYPPMWDVGVPNIDQTQNGCKLISELQLK